jgi:hypothetical protein
MPSRFATPLEARREQVLTSGKDLHLFPDVPSATSAAAMLAVLAEAVTLPKIC